MTDIREQLKTHIESGTSQTAVAKAIGISASALSTWLKGLYKGDSDLLETKLSKYLELQAERAESRSSATARALVKTKTFMIANGFLHRAAVKCHFGLLYGPSGIGKTTAIKAFVQENQGIAILIEADRGYTARTVFLELCGVLNLDTKGSVHDLLMRVVERLSGSQRLIIIDEAEHLPYGALELIRRVRDKAKIGIVLVGMPRLERNIKGDPNHFAQLENRVNACVSLDNLDSNDIEALVVNRLGHVSTEVMQALRKASRNNARILCDGILEWCEDLCRHSGSEISVEIVAKAKSYSSISA